MPFNLGHRWYYLCPPMASFYAGSCLGLIAHSIIKSRIREMKSRKMIKSSCPKKFRTFTLFNSLPRELQLAVWKHALHDIEPRTVKLKLYWWQYKVGGSEVREFLGSILTAQHEYKANIPALLHVCHDSREVAQTKYKLSFGKLLQRRPVYFDIERDTLWVVGGRDHCEAFPLRLLTMDGFQNLIITPSPRQLSIGATETSFEPLKQWLDRLIVLEPVDRIENDISNTNAERLCEAVRNLGIRQDWILGEDIGKCTIPLKTYTITNQQLLKTEADVMY
ncbi:uncharacterized protein Bfra_003982 [Botrytis fragariae]|uniref:2EXR domain-containing protein n=1 Tax=Botrytis fragariae TaxID=1964551 RepID=A0A8H6AXH4_9HELO|nr:uncharacterized protein Bfra_003982 [Botrytis fragariae]KAF5875529.1 hypothetical protein Bfra_003982 [Botrytis fragariae]